MRYLGIALLGLALVSPALADEPAGTPPGVAKSASPITERSFVTPGAIATMSLSNWCSAIAPGSVLAKAP